MIASYLQESNLSESQPHLAPHHVIQAITSEGLAQGPYVADRGGVELATFRTEVTEHHHSANHVQCDRCLFPYVLILYGNGRAGGIPVTSLSYGQHLFTGEPLMPQVWLLQLRLFQPNASCHRPLKPWKL